MKDLFKVKSFLRRNAHASVFLVEYQRRIAELKVSYWYEHDASRSAERSRKGFEILNALKGLPAIPVVFELLEDLNGTYSELGLDKSGRQWHEVVSEPEQFALRNYKNNIKDSDSEYPTSQRSLHSIHVVGAELKEPYFHGAIIMEHLPDAKPLVPAMFKRGINPNAIIHSLEDTVEQVHQRGFGFLGLLNVVLSGNKPYILGSDHAIRLDAQHLKEKPEVVEQIFSLDHKYLEQLSLAYRTQVWKMYQAFH
jgi:hypothetical protein